MPRLRINTTAPGQPSSLMTRLLPPPTTSAAAPASSAARRCVTMSSAVVAVTTRAAGPPRRSVVNSDSRVGTTHDATEARLAAGPGDGRRSADRDAVQHHRSLYRVELGRLVHTRRGDRVHHLRDDAWVDRADRRATARGAHAEQEILCRRREPTGLIGAESVLPGQSEDERPAGGRG